MASTVFITGGNAGIGYEAVKALLQSKKSYLVLMGSRSLDKAHDAIQSLKAEVPETSSTIEPVQIDVANDDAINKAYELVKAKYGKIDALVNNAGSDFGWEYKTGAITRREVFNKTYDVNVSGAVIVTETFMPLLLKSADPRLIFVTSGQSSLHNFSTKGMPLPPSPATGWPKTNELDGTAYRASKSALNMIMLNFTHRLENDKVKIWAVSPGMLATGLGNFGREFMEKLGAKHPSIGGRFIRDVIEGAKDAEAGQVVHSNGTVQPW